MADLRVLLCDDDPDLLGLLTRRVEKMGFEHDVASDGRLAISLVEKSSFDVIVTDIYMPEATGLEVLQFAKQRDPDIQVVIITSSATLDNAIDALNHGAFGYLTKPFDHLIVFDNMVSRAAEYRRLLVANKHKAEAQRRRGDMLEDEVAQRVQQIQKKQKGLLDLLGSLPDGILVVEEGGKVALSSPVGERWLTRDAKAGQQPIHAFISQVNSSGAERTAKVRVEDHDLQLIAVDFPAEGDIRRKAVIIREIESDGIGAGSLVTETVLDIKKRLATLYQQGVGTEAVLNLANQFAVLEQLAGWAPAERGIAAAVEPVVNAGIDTPTPIEEPEGPELNTAELADALRAAAHAKAQPVQPELAVKKVSAPEPLSEMQTGPAPEAAPSIESELFESAPQGAPFGKSELIEPAPHAVPPASVEPPPEPEPPAKPHPVAVPEPTFPTAHPAEAGRVAAAVDTGLFRPRLIPEAMSAKLGEPAPIQAANGNRRPFRIGSSEANTQIFRRVLEKMSGETVIGPGDPDPESEPSPTSSDPSRSRNPASSAVETHQPIPAPEPAGFPAHKTETGEPEPIPEAMAEPAAPVKRPRPPRPKEPEPRPSPAKVEPAGWPPQVPSEDPDWDDSLDTG